MDENFTVSIPVEADNNGYLDKECPSENCLFKFKVFADDWGEFKNKKKFCPLCGHKANYDVFWTTEQLKNAKDQAVKQAMNIFSDRLSNMAKNFNNKKSDGFLSMKIKHSYIKNKIKPILAEEEFEQKITCKKCNLKYSVRGAAFFCPFCGNNSVSEMFDSSMDKIESNINFILNLKEKSDEIENLKITTFENSISDTLIVYESFCQKTYKEKYNPNDNTKFQNIKNANKTWKKIFGEDYRDWLTSDEFNKFKKFFQKRHLLIHSSGIVNQEYLNKTQDKEYKLEQRIVIKEDSVFKFIYLTKKIINKIRTLSGAIR